MELNLMLTYLIPLHQEMILTILWKYHAMVWPYVAVLQPSPLTTTIKEYYKNKPI
jgi:hypothetical protein